MRLFTGTFIKGIITGEVYSAVRKDFAGSAFGKWVEPENIHFTYKFLGDTDSKTCVSLISEIKTLKADYNEELIIQGIGTFPSPQKPRILYAGIEYNKLLSEINSEIERITTGLGFVAEGKKFNPHITLLRIKDFKKRDFIEVLEKYKNYEFGKVAGFRVSLIESCLSSAGSVYREIG